MPLNVTITPGGLWTIVTFIAGNLLLLVGALYRAHRWSMGHAKDKQKLISTVDKMHVILEGNGRGNMATRLDESISGIEMLTTKTDEIKEDLSLINGKVNANMEVSSLAYVVTTADGRNTEVSPTYAKALGCSTDELMGFAWANYMPPEEREVTEPEWKRLFRERRKGTFETVMRHKDGHPVYWHGTNYPTGIQDRCLVVLREIKKP